MTCPDTQRQCATTGARFSTAWCPRIEQLQCAEKASQVHWWGDCRKWLRQEAARVAVDRRNAIGVRA